MCDSNPEGFWRAHKKIKIDADCRDLLSGMLAYRAKNRLTLDECLRHKWVAKRPILGRSQLHAVVKKKHQEARRLRRNDKTKTQMLDNSIKERKKRIIRKSVPMTESKEFQELRCPVRKGFEIPVVENLVPTMLTFFAHKC